MKANKAFFIMRNQGQDPKKGRVYFPPFFFGVLPVLFLPVICHAGRGVSPLKMQQCSKAKRAEESGALADPLHRPRNAIAGGQRQHDTDQQQQAVGGNMLGQYRAQRGRRHAAD